MRRVESSSTRPWVVVVCRPGAGHAEVRANRRRGALHFVIRISRCFLCFHRPSIIISASSSVRRPSPIHFLCKMFSSARPYRRWSAAIHLIPANSPSSGDKDEQSDGARSAHAATTAAASTREHATMATTAAARANAVQHKSAVPVVHLPAKVQAASATRSEAARLTRLTRPLFPGFSRCMGPPGPSAPKRLEETRPHPKASSVITSMVPPGPFASRLLLFHGASTFIDIARKAHGDKLGLLQSIFLGSH